MFSVEVLAIELFASTYTYESGTTTKETSRWIKTFIRTVVTQCAKD
jgi:hypothetical protein